MDDGDESGLSISRDRRRSTHSQKQVHASLHGPDTETCNVRHVCSVCVTAGIRDVVATDCAVLPKHYFKSDPSGIWWSTAKTGNSTETWQANRLRHSGRLRSVR